MTPSKSARIVRGSVKDITPRPPIPQEILDHPDNGDGRYNLVDWRTIPGDDRRPKVTQVRWRKDRYTSFGEWIDWSSTRETATVVVSLPRCFLAEGFKDIFGWPRLREFQAAVDLPIGDAMLLCGLVLWAQGELPPINETPAWRPLKPKGSGDEVQGDKPTDPLDEIPND